MQAVKSIAGEPTDGFCDDHVNVSGHALVDHTLEFRTLLCVGTGDAVIGEDSCQLPFRIFLNVLCVVGDLCVIACFLFIRIRADSAVGCNAELRLFRFLNCISDLASGRNDHNVTHQTASLSMRL